MLMLDSQDVAKIAFRIRELPGGQSMSDRILNGFDEWASIAELLFFCGGFPYVEFNALSHHTDFDIRWPLSYAACYFGSSGGSVDTECLEFVVGIERQQDAKNALNDYIGDQWLEAWKTGMLVLFRPHELPNNPMNPSGGSGVC